MFSQAEWTDNGSGRHVCLKGAAAAFSCRVSQSLLMGTHRLFFGLVEQAAAGTAEALIYHARDYARPTRF
ncbi:flavin reductase family protein [Komagataeibacter rhaeticus]|nr:flavin reductase family protein [Komagataeibacter rhaeticus]